MSCALEIKMKDY